jgi:dihydrofolate synthase/folylpolyglutamate synthase
MLPVSEDTKRFLESRELFGWQLGLARISRLAKAAGHPERRYQVIHVAGTNGKGSTAAMFEAVLRFAGYRTGLYTSPHLIALNERIRIDGAPIETAAFENLLARQRPLLEQAGATYFEALTLLAFAAFAEADVQVAVIEVGLGGRLDATNIVKPGLCVIPSIDLDHQQFLGHTIDRIAVEKAGILKRGAACVIGQMPMPAKHEIGLRAKLLDVPLVEAWQHCTLTSLEIAEDGNRLFVATEAKEAKLFHSSLIGRHQVNNTLCVIAGVHALNQRGFRISESALDDGLKNTRWPGRFQVIHAQPRLVLDVAHNPAGMRAFIETYQQVYPHQHSIVVMGVLEDKDHVNMLRPWQSLAGTIIFCAVQSKRGRAPEELAQEAEKLSIAAEVQQDPLQAIRRAQELAGAHGVVCVTGSHYLVGEALGRLDRMQLSS